MEYINNLFSKQSITSSAPTETELEDCSEIVNDILIETPRNEFALHELTQNIPIVMQNTNYTSLHDDYDVLVFSDEVYTPPNELYDEIDMAFDKEIFQKYGIDVNVVVSKEKKIFTHLKTAFPSHNIHDRYVSGKCLFCGNVLYVSVLVCTKVKCVEAFKIYCSTFFLRNK